jgi:hypothetical protein
MAYKRQEFARKVPRCDVSHFWLRYTPFVN